MSLKGFTVLFLLGESLFISSIESGKDVLTQFSNLVSICIYRRNHNWQWLTVGGEIYSL